MKVAIRISQFAILFCLASSAIAGSVVCTDSATVAQFVKDGDGPCRYLVVVVNERPCSILSLLDAFGVSRVTSESLNASALCERSRTRVSSGLRKIGECPGECVKVPFSFVLDFPRTSGGCDAINVEQCPYGSRPNLRYSLWRNGASDVFVPLRKGTHTLLGRYRIEGLDPAGEFPRYWINIGGE